ncbi:MAG: ribosomal protein [Planctomycetota bacterium]|jgi:large subunit ribosomal protein L10
MSKPVKNLIASEYESRFKDLTGAVVVEIRGLDAQSTTSMRNSLRTHGIQVTVVKNTLARRTFKGGPLEKLEGALKGPSALLTGDLSPVLVARQIVKAAETEAKIVLKGAIFDGEYYEGDAGVKKLGSFPTREEAQAKVVTLVLSPARQIMGAVKTLQEKLEAGETIAKIA